MRPRVVPRLVRLLTLLAFLSGMQAIAPPLTAAAIDIKAGAPMQDCDSCGHDAMPAAQCAAVCAFTLVYVGESIAFVHQSPIALRPMIAAMPAGRSIPPDTAPPRP